MDGSQTLVSRFFISPLSMGEARKDEEIDKRRKWNQE
jgi:hypothetical protein